MCLCRCMHHLHQKSNYLKFHKTVSSHQKLSQPTTQTFLQPDPDMYAVTHELMRKWSGANWKMLFVIIKSFLMRDYCWVIQLQTSTPTEPWCLGLWWYLRQILFP
jgi:hypothetical protein